jgi:hypothetical protein
MCWPGQTCASSMEDNLRGRKCAVATQIRSAAAVMIRMSAAGHWAPAFEFGHADVVRLLDPDSLRTCHDESPRRALRSNP